MIEHYFNDNRHRHSEQEAFSAELSERSGDFETARAHYAEAARLEETCAQDIPKEATKIRTLLAISAVALWLRAMHWNEAARAGCLFLAQPDKLTSDGVRELKKLVDRAWRTAEIEDTLGQDSSFVPLEARMSGGLVRQGIAPSIVIAERREVLTSLLIRVAEWRNQRKFRRAGQSPLSNSYEILEAPALAASYSLRLYFGATGQQTLTFATVSPKDIVDHFLCLSRAVSQGADALESEVKDPVYSQAFLRSFRDLSPDGKRVEHVEFSSMIRGKSQTGALFTPETRERLTQSLRRADKEQPILAKGILKSINLRGMEPKLGIDEPDGLHIFRIAKGEHDDTIGPKLNRLVRITGTRRVNEDGEAADWADNITLLDDDAGESRS